MEIGCENANKISFDFRSWHKTQDTPLNTFRLALVVFIQMNFEYKHNMFCHLNRMKYWGIDSFVLFVFSFENTRDIS